MREMVEVQSMEVCEERAMPGTATRRRFAILLAGHSNAFSMRTQGDFSDMFIKLLADKDGTEDWIVYSVVDDQFPTQEELQTLSGLVITGSKFDAHGMDPWIVKLRELLKSVYEQGSMRMLGVCFGCQILAHSLGGLSGRADCGYEAGIRELTATEALNQLPYAKGMPGELRLLEVHQDQVKALPPGAVLLASSPKTPVEMFAIGRGVLAIQGHPEFSADIVESIVEELLLSKIITPATASEARASMSLQSPTNSAFRNVCVSFLKES